MPEQIAGDPEFADFFEAAAAGMAGKEAQTVANLLVNEMIAYLKGAGVSLAESGHRASSGGSPCQAAGDRCHQLQPGARGL